MQWLRARTGISRALPRSPFACFCRRSFPACSVSGAQGERGVTFAGRAWGWGRRAGCRLSAQEGGLGKGKLTVPLGLPWIPDPLAGGPLLNQSVHLLCTCRMGACEGHVRTCDHVVCPVPGFVPRSSMDFVREQPWAPPGALSLAWGSGLAPRPRVSRSPLPDRVQ